MFLTPLLFTATLCTLSTLAEPIHVGPAGAVEIRSDSAAATSSCSFIKNKVSGIVFYKGALEYTAAIAHQYNSSAQEPACVVLPRAASEVATTMTSLTTYSPRWAIQGGGHQSNPGFSSTTGVHINLSKMSHTTVNAGKGTIDVGAGSTWQQAYDALAGTGLGVPGARATGPGVSGVTLGGGWTWVTNERGLSIDNQVSIEAVVPNGTVITASETSYPDLFFAMRGGGNKFGIATKFTFKSYPQGNVYAGAITVGGDGNQTLINAAGKAISDWAVQNKDPKATIQMAVFYNPDTPPVANFFMLYNAPTAPAGTFKIIEALPRIADTRKADIPFNVFIAANQVPKANRASQSGLPITKWSPAYVQASIDTANAMVAKAKADKKSFYAASIFFEPYVPVWASFSKGGAYPHDSSDPAAPFGIYVEWSNAVDDGYFQDATMDLTNTLRTKSLATGDVKKTTALYPNYANWAQPIELLYQQNVAKLQAIKAKNDPCGIMDKAGWYSI